MKNFNKYISGLCALLLFIAFQLEAQTLPVSAVEQPSKEWITMKLFPNPSSGEFRIEINMEEKATLTAKLFDMTGKMVENLSDRIQEGNSMYTGDIRLEGLSSGIYFLRIESKGKSATKKVIIR